MIETYEKGDKKRTSTEYNRLQKCIANIRRKLDEIPTDATGRPPLVKELRSALSAPKKERPVRNDDTYIRTRYVRYADDWCIGLNGPRHLAEQMRDEIKNFMSEKLGLTLNMGKTHIRHAKDEEAFFLGTRVKVGSYSQKIVRITDKNGRKYDKRITGWLPQLFAPCDKLVARLHSKDFCDAEGNRLLKAHGLLSMMIRSS